MEKRIGIIGAGVAGLHLGLYLRQHDTSATIITDRTAEQIARGRADDRPGEDARRRSLG
jgi:2-polyprenyl-6-methoxyphenol hydroxylase-like FAD-dependent oxidoreductase